MEIHTCYNIKVTENWVITGLHYAVTAGLSVLEVKYISVSKRGRTCWQEQFLNAGALTRGKRKLDFYSCVSLICCLLQKWSLCRKKLDYSKENSGRCSRHGFLGNSPDSILAELVWTERRIQLPEGVATTLGNKICGPFTCLLIIRHFAVNKIIITTGFYTALPSFALNSWNWAEKNPIFQSHQWIDICLYISCVFYKYWESDYLVENGHTLQNTSSICTWICWSALQMLCPEGRTKLRKWVTKLASTS